MYKIILSNSSEKFIRKAEKDLSKRLFEKIQKLEENPFPSDCKRVENQMGKIFRVRVGKCRILYEVLKERLIIQIIKIDKRSKAYQNE
jgi:mRNA interferase RelE/StbE